MIINRLYAMWARQVKKYLRSKARMIGSLGQPILFLVALGFGLNNVVQGPNGTSYVQFLAPGIIAMSILFTAIFSGIEIIWDRQFGFLKEMMVAPISRFELMVGRTLGNATVAFIQGVLVFAITLLVGFRPISWATVPLALLIMFIIALLFTAVGTAIASVLEDMQGFPIIMNFLVMPLFFLSGALFPLETAPKVLRIIAATDPMSYGVDGLHAVLIGAAHYGILIDMLGLAGFTLAFLALGSYLFSRIQL